MVKSSAVKKSRRKSQREAAKIQRQTDAALAMEEEEDIVFKRLRTVPNTPRASRDNTPDPDDREEEPKDFTAVLQMVKTVRDQLTSLVLDNTNIRAACDDLRRQCHSQGVAFGDLSTIGEPGAGGPGGDPSILAWGDRTTPSYPAGVVRR